MLGTKVATVVSVRVGSIRTHARPAWDEVRSRPWSTAFWKDEVAGPVRVGTLGLAGDQQADTANHGGPEMALLMYADSHYPSWRALAGLEAMGPGGFGENLTVSDVDETRLCVGDVLEVGGARLQIASPRGPCADISRRWNAEWLLKRVLAQRRTGWYLRVQTEGPVTHGDDVRLASRPHPGWTVDRVLRLRYEPPRSPADLAEAAALAGLAPEWRARFAKLMPASQD